MTLTEQLREIYGAYVEKTLELQRNRKPMQGFLGFGGRLGDDPCHRQFAEDVASAVEAAETTSEEAAEAMQFVLKIAEEHKNNELAYWMLLAVHGKVSTLAAKLAPADAQTLLTWYEKQYPRRIQLPVQKDLVKQLKAAMK